MGIYPLWHTTLGGIHERVYDFVQPLLDLATEHHFHHSIELRIYLHPEIGFGPLGIRVKMDGDRKMKRSAIVLNDYQVVRTALNYLDSYSDALNSGLQSIKIGLDHRFFVLREHMRKIAQIHKRHIEVVLRSGDDTVLAGV